jgi:D-sedoheptulose 7-phosphate isomerase
MLRTAGAQTGGAWTAGARAELAPLVAAAIRARSQPAREFFAAHAAGIAAAARIVAERLDAGGRIYAFGRGAYATDAQHVAVEFVHPVLVGKPALPASDLSLSFETALPVLAGPQDVVIGFGPPGGDESVARALDEARARGAFAIALPGRADSTGFAEHVALSNGADSELGDLGKQFTLPGGAQSDARGLADQFVLPAASDDEHLHQELVEITGHLLYESVHVFLEHRHLDHDAGASAFLYPFLGGAQASAQSLDAGVLASIMQKAADAEALRERVASEESEAIAAAVATIAGELDAGGRLLLFGNGGSSTDATDFALDCVQPPPGLAPIPALSLAAEPATITAIANDVGREFIFLRQLIAHVRPHDVVLALSTSGGSSNVIAALEEARKRGNATIALLGYDGGEIRRRALADRTIVVRSDYIPRVQEAQAAVYHTMRHALGWIRDGS